MGDIIKNLRWERPGPTEPDGPPLPETKVDMGLKRGGGGNDYFLYDDLTLLGRGLNAKGIVWAFLRRFAYIRAKRGQYTITVANGELAKLGVKRNAKTRALRQLEADGLIRVDWQDRRSPEVTMLVPLIEQKRTSSKQK